MNSENKGHTEVHMHTPLLKCRNQLCTCVRGRGAVLEDEWEVLDTDCGIKDYPLISQHSAPLANASTHMVSKF